MDVKRIKPNPTLMRAVIRNVSWCPQSMQGAEESN